MDFLSGLVNDMIKESTGYDVRKVSRLVGGKKKRRKKGRKGRGGGGGLLAFGAGAALAGGVATLLQQQQSQGGGEAPSGGIAGWDAPRGPAPAPAVPPPAPPQAAPPQPSAAPPATPQPATPQPATPQPSTPQPSGLPPASVASPPPLPGVPQAASPTPPAVAPPGLPAPPPTAPPPLPSSPTTHGTAAPALPFQADEISEEDELDISAELTFAIVRSMIAAALADGHLDEREKRVIQGRLEESGLSAEQKQQVHRDLVMPATPEELAALSADPEDREAMYRFAGLLILADGEVAALERSFLDRLAVALSFDGARQAALEEEIFS